jgi:hypothetical protein
VNYWRRKAIPLRHIAEAKPVPIVSDASMATRGLADGRLIPLFILDTSERPDIDDMIGAHQHLGAGDASSTWSLPARFDRSKIRLILTAVKPSHCVIVLEFDVVRQGGVVDQIVQAQGLYLQGGRPGDRLAFTLDHGRILVEVPCREFRPEWDRIFRKALTKDYRRRGLSRSDARDSTDSFIKHWREFTSKRMKSEYDDGA